MQTRSKGSRVEGRGSRAGSRGGRGGRRSEIGGRKEGLHSSVPLCGFCVSFFSTDFGWFGLWGNDDGVLGLVIGHASRESARRSIRERLTAELPDAEWAEDDWHPELRRRLQDYTLGRPDDFRDVCVLLPKLTAFQRAVIDATRQIPCGETRSYAELAAEAGRPGAARAVGNVMASNRVPVIIPCHRVVASGGKWGGFSAPQGVDLKRRMLDVEAAGLVPVG